MWWAGNAAQSVQKLRYLQQAYDHCSGRSLILVLYDLWGCRFSGSLFSCRWGRLLSFCHGWLGCFCVYSVTFGWGASAFILSWNHHYLIFRANGGVFFLPFFTTVGIVISLITTVRDIYANRGDENRPEISDNRPFSPPGEVFLSRWWFSFIINHHCIDKIQNSGETGDIKTSGRCC